MRIGRAAAAVILILAFGVSAWFGLRRAVDPPDLSAHRESIDATAHEFGLDADLLRALVAVESGGDPEAVSGAGAVGLVQLMPATAREEAGRLGVADFSESRLIEPVLNLRLGASYLSRLLKRFDGELAFALAAYNAGPARVLRWREKSPHLSARAVVETHGFDETRRHLARVLSFRDAYRAQKD